MSKTYFIISLMVVLIIGFFVGAIIFNSPEETTQAVHSANYYAALAEVEKGNAYVIENDVSDSCFIYRYFHRGCYYDNSGKTYQFEGNFETYNLTHQERVELCTLLAHKGGAANCLRLNGEKERCLEYANNNSYLVRICNLKENELIPSTGMGPYPAEGSVFKVDSWETIDSVKYSELF